MTQLTVLFIKKEFVTSFVNLVLLLYMCFSSSCEHAVSMCFSVLIFSLQLHSDDSNLSTLLQYKYYLRSITSILIWMSTELFTFTRFWCILSLVLSEGALTVTLHLTLDASSHCAFHSLSTVFLPVLSSLTLSSAHFIFFSITGTLVSAVPFVFLLLHQTHIFIIKYWALMNSSISV